MAGRPRTRARMAREALGIAEDEELPADITVNKDGEIVVRQGGNGSYRSFSEMTKDELQLMQRKSVERRRQKRELKRLGELQAWHEANKELAGVVFGAKAQLLEGLIRKALDDDGTIDPGRLEKHEMVELVKMLNSYEDRMFGKAAQRVEHTGKVELQHRVAQIIEGLNEGG